MKPTLGRIVNFVDNDHITRSAIVTGVFDDDSVSLAAFDHGQKRVIFYDVVPYADPEDDAEWSWHLPEGSEQRKVESATKKS
jgi:hypothetical protein